jgi:hypothetical protein
MRRLRNMRDMRDMRRMRNMRGMGAKRRISRLGVRRSIGIFIDEIDHDDENASEPSYS